MCIIPFQCLQLSPSCFLRFTVMHHCRVVCYSSMNMHTTCVALEYYRTDRNSVIEDLKLEIESVIADL
jgi:hypothetical protein